MAPGRHTNGAPWPILMAHPRCAISIPDTNGAPGGAPLVKITNGVLLMAHHRCAINGHIRCAISRGFSSSVCAMHILYAHWFSLVHMLNFLCYHMLICHFEPFWTTWMTSDVIGSINGYVFICPICISLDFGRLVHAYLLCVNSHALFALFDPIYIW